jgi:hypothetical protein
VVNLSIIYLSAKQKYTLVKNEAVKVTGSSAFFETISQNQGLPAEIFRDIDEAKRWLMNDGGK